MESQRLRFTEYVYQKVDISLAFLLGIIEHMSYVKGFGPPSHPFDDRFLEAWYGFHLILKKTVIEGRKNQTASLQGACFGDSFGLQSVCAKGVMFPMPFQNSQGDINHRTLYYPITYLCGA
jgi:hypothetical protein